MVKTARTGDDFIKKVALQLGLIGFAAAAFALAAYLLVMRISALGALIEDVARKKTTKEQGIEALAALRSEATLARPAALVLQAKLPPRDALFNVSKRVQAIAQDAGVKTTFAFGVESSGSADVPARVGIEMSVTGGLLATKQFVHDLEASEYLLTISAVDWSNGNARISGSIFYQPEPPTQP